MGNNSGYFEEARGCGTTVLALQHVIPKPRIPMDMLMFHCTPATFPLRPVINTSTSKMLKNSWQLITRQMSIGSGGEQTSGITIFYKEFYYRLAAVDSGGLFDFVLTRNMNDGANQLEAKGAILIRMMKYILSIEEDSRDTQNRLYVLGKSHSHKVIRPWQYSIFMETLLLTISSRLGTDATTDVMEAWVNMFAFVLKWMLPSALEPPVSYEHVNDINIAESFEFQSDDGERLVDSRNDVKAKDRACFYGSTDSELISQGSSLSSVDIGKRIAESMEYS